MLLGHLLAHGWAASVMVFGSGGALLQKVNRDKYKFAQKASAILVRRPTNRGDSDLDGPTTTEWMGIAKDPVTDQGKKSLEGVITAIRNVETGEYRNHDLREAIPEGWVDAMRVRWATGIFYNKTVLAEVRARVDAALGL
jgi:nicotinamide phosphoribosyltransferase